MTAKHSAVWTPHERAMCAAGCVYIKDPKQARDGQRAVCRKLDQFEREDLIFDHDAFAVWARQNP